ncbi:hypothetical protein SCOR_34890 [Sulfidibacter corallicola]|uniref:Uncharacterized protein n=1 Tax=Sulfidibacter corallicola TaxID=2818388 RepID=A0A8A4TGS9_SULCO|nr:hypothetical protein [Sulfidibacter corallicola]QTD49279.1 hypothetical protein J3U87_27145 [Sulfidibacter corallicola]
MKELSPECDLAYDLTQDAPALLEGLPDTPATKHAWLERRAHLEAAYAEEQARQHLVAASKHDESRVRADALTQIEKLRSEWRLISQKLDAVQSQFFPVSDDCPKVFRAWQRQVEARQENHTERKTEIEREIAEMAREHREEVGTARLDWRGHARPLTSLIWELTGSSRRTREEAWRVVSQEYYRLAPFREERFSRMVNLRREWAPPTEGDDFRALVFRQAGLDALDAATCRQYAEACEKVVVPALRVRDERHRRFLGVEVLYPWDMQVPAYQAPPPLGDNPKDLIPIGERLFEAMDPELHAWFKTLVENQCMHIETWPDSTAESFLVMRDLTGLPYLSLTLTTSWTDLHLLLQELGKAFHYLACRHRPTHFDRNPSTGSLLMASYALELLSMEYWDHLYPNPRDCNLAKREQYERVLALLPRFARLDRFESQIYHMPIQSAVARCQLWCDLDERMGRTCDWFGLEHLHAVQWHQERGLLETPFSSIEHALALLVALDLWMTARAQGTPEAISQFKELLALGNARGQNAILRDWVATHGTWEGRLGEVVEALTAELTLLDQALD